MVNSDFKNEVEKILSLGDIKINGDRPWDIQVHNDGLYRRIINERDLGLGEAYMDGWWDVKELDQFFFRVMHHRLDQKVKIGLYLIWLVAISAVFNRQSKSRAFTIGEKHYDTGNDLFKAILGPSMAYSCAYWETAKNLDDAQNAKYDLICRKIGLKPGMSVLDIGCGWGTFLRHAAKNYGVHGVGVTVSKEQAELARELCKGLPVEIILQDYRELDGKFDCVVSIGMFEHVGYKNHRAFMEVVDRCLKDDGLFLLHTIGSDRWMTTTDAWTEKYIFPNGHLPCVKQIGDAYLNLFVMEDWHNFGSYYGDTLKAWNDNFEKGWPALKDKYSERFYRMWRY